MFRDEFGFFGASSTEGLPTEVAMTENMRRFDIDEGVIDAWW